MKANRLFCCPSKSPPHAGNHRPSVDFPHGCFLSFFPFCHRFFYFFWHANFLSCWMTHAVPSWCLLPVADFFITPLNLSLPSVFFYVFFQTSFGTAACPRTIKSCTMEIWRRALREKSPTTLCRTNVSLKWNHNCSFYRSLHFIWMMTHSVCLNVFLKAYPALKHSGGSVERVLASVSFTVLKLSTDERRGEFYPSTT